MPNFTVYINNDNEDNFKNEQSKSTLVNSLLSSHYSTTSGSARSAKVEVTPRGVKPMKYEQIPPTDLKPDTSNIIESKLEYCEGHAMRWDCGKKGCQYA